jgi:hypothetical protein
MIAVRPTTAGDLSGLAALFASRFGHPLTPEEWAWKYRLLPGEARSLVAVGAGGAVLAHAGALRLPARWRGGEGGIWQLVDFAGSARGGGLRPALVELGRRLLEDLPAAGEAPWIFGFPSERHFRLGERVFGYRPLTTLEPLAGELADLQAGAGERLERPAGAEGSIEIGDACGDWAEAVWQRCAVLGVRRSAAFLNWRYWARPRRYYRFYRLCADGQEALAVFAFVGDEAWATELWLPPAGEWYSPMLAIAADLCAAGFRAWRFWPPPLPAAPAAPAADGFPCNGTAGAGGPTVCLLRRLGVRPAGEPRFVGCCGARGADAADAADAAVDPAAAAGGFYFAMGDYDLA